MNGTRFHPGAIIYGIVFIVLGTLFLLDDRDVLDLDATVVIPILLIGLGLGVVAGAWQRTGS